MKEKFKIHMPHRHTVTYEDEDVVLDFDVELSKSGIIFYPVSPKVKSGKSKTFTLEAMRVEGWLKSKFSNVEIDKT